ncbi:MAG: SLBB domain-containing protein [Methylophilaceae bacterium]
MLANAGDVKQDYVLGAGDMVRVTVYGSPDLTTETRISAAGTLTFPLLGDVSVGGLSTAIAEKKIATNLEEGGFVKQPQVNLVVLQFQSQTVSVLGEVNRPGRYPLDRPSTLTDVLAMASGVTSNGSEIVTVTSLRDGKPEKHEYDLREWFDRGQASQNPSVRGDDIIFVTAREVSVLGQVGRPGKYSVMSGVRNVGDFLSMAGGIAPTGADTIVISIVREGKMDKREIDVDQLFRSGDTAANIELRGGDMIYVPRAPLFYIYGEVQRPGSFRLERNMTVAQALSVGGGLSLRGTERGIVIKRRDAKGNMQEIEPQATDIVQADDVIQISESLF